MSEVALGRAVVEQGPQLIVATLGDKRVEFSWSAVEAGGAVIVKATVAENGDVRPKLIGWDPLSAFHVVDETGDWVALRRSDGVEVARTAAPVADAPALEVIAL